MLKEAACGIALFLAMFAVMHMAVDVLCSNKGDYVGPTPTVIKK